MVLTTNTPALQYAAGRPDKRLVVEEAAAAPLFWLTLVVIVQERSALGPIPRYLVRAIDRGLRDPSELAEYLGLDRAVVDRTLVDLWQADLVDLVPATTDGRAVVLTSRGKEAATQASTLRIEQTELEVAFDRLTWEVTPALRQHLLRPRDVRAGGWRQLDPRKGSQPTIKDLPLGLVRSALEVRGVLSADPENRTRELIGIRAIKQADRVFRPVDLVAFGPEGGQLGPIDPSDVEIAIGVEGHISREHSMAFAATPHYTRLAREVAEAPPAEDRELPPDVAAMEAPAEEVAELQSRLADAERRLERTERRMEAEDAPAPDIRTSTEDLRRQRDELSDRLASIQFRQLLTWELADVLRDARYGSRRRLLIISPWISGQVVDADFLQSLGRLTTAGVPVHIGYGFPGEDQRDDPRVVRDLNRLADRSGGRFVFRRLGTTHEKVLIFDNTIVTGSFNWLSFKGDPKLPLRRESGTLIKNEAFVDEQYDLYRAVIEGRDLADDGSAV